MHMLIPSAYWQEWYIIYVNYLAVSDRGTNDEVFLTINVGDHTFPDAPAMFYFQ